MISVTPPPITRASTVTLNGVTLPSPRVNDTETVQLTRVNRQTRGLKRRMYRTSDWYGLYIVSYTFANLTLAQKDSLTTAVKTASAITVTDHLSTARTMYVQEIGVIEEVRDDECSYQIDLVLHEVI